MTGNFPAYPDLAGKVVVVIGGSVEDKREASCRLGLCKRLAHKRRGSSSKCRG
jgi:hypothetical protein